MIHWLRHGESTWNAAGRLQHQNPAPPLTENGRRQALDAAERLRETRVDAVVSSPARRTIETAEIVADVLGLAVHVDPRLVEQDRDESRVQVRSRILDLLADRTGELVVVSHGDTIAIAVELLTGRPCDVPANADVIVTGFPERADAAR